MRTSKQCRLLGYLVVCRYGGSWGRGLRNLLLGGYQHGSISQCGCAIYARVFVIISCTSRVLHLGASGKYVHLYRH